MVALRDGYPAPLTQYGGRDRSKFEGETHFAGLQRVAANGSHSQNGQNVSSGTYTRTRDVSSGLYGVQKRLKRESRKSTNTRRYDFDLGHPYWSETVTMSKPMVTGQMVYFPLRLYGNTYTIMPDSFYPDSSVAGMANKLRTSSLTMCDNVGLRADQMIALGTDGIARALPGVPPVSVFQFLGELREGLPKIPGTNLISGKQLKKDFHWDNILRKGWKTRVSDLGGEYLNVAFGLLPFAADIIGLIDLARNYESIRDSLQHELTTATRRHRFIGTNTSVTSTAKQSYGWPVMPAQYNGLFTTTVTTKQDFWVDSAFDYRPVLTSLEGALKRLNDFTRGWDVLPTPANLWELVPYSWLVDWLVNFGSVFKNLSYLSTNGVALRYAYAMAKTTVTTRYEWLGVAQHYPASSVVELKAEVRQRARSTPYGFGFSYATLSSRQLAILAALGISRSKSF